MKTSFQKLPSEITSRELEVIQLISNEFSSREIANLLYISEETVKSHRKNIRKKAESAIATFLPIEDFKNPLITWLFE